MKSAVAIERAARSTRPTADRFFSDREPRPRLRADATTVLTVYVVLLICIPSTLIFKPLGAAGTPANMLGFLALAWWVGARCVPHLGVSVGPQPVRSALVVFALAILASYVAAFTRPILPIEAASADRGILTLLSWAGVALLVADGVATRARLNTLLRRLANAGCALAVVGMIQFFEGINVAAYIKIPGLTANGGFEDFISQRSVFRRVAGTAIHPIEFATVLTMILPIALHFAFTAPKNKRLWPWARVTIIGLTIPLSVSRTAVVGLIAGLLTLFATWTPRRRARALACLPFFAVMVRVLVPGLIGTITGLFTGYGNDPSVQGRIGRYDRIYALIGQRPIFGRGFRTFIPSQYFFLDNQYMGTLIETGVVGFIALITVFAVGIFTARGARRRSQDSATRDLGQSLVAATVVAAAGCATFDLLSFPMVSGLVFFILGAAGALWRVTQAEEGEGAPAPRWGPGAVALA